MHGRLVNYVNLGTCQTQAVTPIMSAADRRVRVQLSPRASAGRRLRIDNFATRRELSKVLEHCTKHWKEDLQARGNPPITLFLFFLSYWHCFFSR